MDAWVKNVAAVAGLAMFGVGLWMHYPPASLIIVGLLLLGGSIWGHMRAT